jgi:alginate O-acetyltransferase complex protein AlgI
MVFNSFTFLIYITIIFLLFWLIKPEYNRVRNFLLLFASYFFYSCWDVRFLILLIFSTLLDFYTGAKIYSQFKSIYKKKWLYLSVIINLGLLCYFKYFNFFVLSFHSFLIKLNLNISISLLNIVLPVGISFYTFHGLSYVLDIYNDKIKPEKSLINYSLFVSYFPLLVAGPIERASHLLPQLKTIKRFNYENSILGLRQILWGLFKKIVIADNCALYVNQIYGFESGRSGFEIFIATILFAFQIYGDFSGYSDMALGLSRLFGIELIKNFSFPYFSRDIAEFWRRWHISLSSWFRDYLYYPLGGSKFGVMRSIINTFVIFLVSGFWHGANWTFIFWGGLNAIFFIPLLLNSKNRKNIDVVAENSILPSIKELFQMLSTFLIICLGWLFFRSSNLNVAYNSLKKIISFQSFFKSTTIPSFSIIYLILFMLIIEWNGRNNNFAIEKMRLYRVPFFRYIFYLSIIYSLFYFGGEEKQYIYFQF